MKVQAYNMVEFIKLPKELQDCIDVMSNDVVQWPREEFDTLQDLFDQEGSYDKAEEWCPISWWCYKTYTEFDVRLPVLLDISW